MADKTDKNEKSEVIDSPKKLMRTVDCGSRIFTYNGRHWGPGVVEVWEGDTYLETEAQVNDTADVLEAAVKRLKDDPSAPITERFGGTAPLV